MSTARQKHQPIALADILVDEDQLTPRSDLDVPTLDRMHIHIDMTDSQYWSTHRPDPLPSTCLADPQTTLAFQDVTPFTSVSSFNYPATADNTLLTPISNAGSPSLQQRSATKGTMPVYHAQPSTSSAQQPTPPNTSTGGFYPNPYDLSSSSQSSSPHTLHPHHSAEYTMTPYSSRHSPNIMHGHPSPRDDHQIPPPPDQHYLGHFSVSGNDPETNVSPQFDYNPSCGLHPSVFSPQESRLTNMHAMHTVQYGQGPTPILAPTPDPSQLRHTLQPRVEDVCYGPPPTSYQGTLDSSHPRRDRNKVAKRTPRRQSRLPQNREPTPRAREKDAASLGDGEEAVTLSDKCEDEARFIFNARNKLINTGMKGKGMWEEIARMFEETYGQRHEKATLQMRLTRTVAKHVIWPEKELERLREAYEYVEQRRYKLVLARMKEQGGGQCWNWTPQLIEAKLIDMGFEEANIDEKTKTRKRRRRARQIRAMEAQHSQAILQGNDQLWGSTGLGLHHHSVLPAQGTMHHPHHDNSADPDDMMPQYTPQQRDQYIDECVSKIKPEEDASSPEPDAMDVSYNGSEDNRDQSGHQVARMAKQGIEQLMLNQIRM